MLRSLFISLSKAKWAQRAITRLPLAWRVASRFIAGETTQSAIKAVQELNSHGIQATLDFLGENTTSLEEAQKSTQEVIAILEAIQVNGVRSNVSIKLSQIGLTIDQEFCHANLGHILTRAHEYGNFVRIDMEDSTLTEKTIQALRWAHQNGFTNTGIVLQAYLYRTERDLIDLAMSGVPIRLCKGAYQEPANLAYPKMTDVNASYDALVRQLIQASLAHQTPPISTDGRTPPLPAIASHDPQRIQAARRQAQELGLPKSAIEFQMLYGIRRDLQTELVAEGYPVRVYVPYGSHWYPYFMRRLAERPANVWFFVSNFFKK